MDCTLTNQSRECNSATAQAETFNLIIGCQRATGWTGSDLIGLLMNGAGLIRDGNAFRLIASEAFEQGALS